MPFLDECNSLQEFQMDMPYSLQNRMEIALLDLNEPDYRVFQDDAHRFLPVHKWRGVKMNRAGEIIEINWDNLFQEKAKFNFSLLPPTVEVFSANNCSLTGSLSFTYFPRELRSLSLRGNHLSGKLNLSDLPKQLECLDVVSNEFSGKLSLKNLPKSLRFLYLNGNAFEGKLNLKYLPRSLVNLNLTRNKFSKNIKIGNLPEHLLPIALFENAIDVDDVLKNCVGEEAEITRNRDGAHVLKDHSGRVMALW